MAVQVPLAGSYSSVLARAVIVKSPCNKDHAVLQQRRRVTITCGVEAACGSPGPARRVVQFRARGSDVADNPPATRTMPFCSNVAV